MPAADAATARVAGYYDREARHYDAEMRLWDWLLDRRSRAWIGSRAHGDILEIAIGTGRNLPYYAPDVRLTGIDISPAMLEIARQRALDLGREVELRVGDAQALDFPDQSFDSVVSALSLCTIPNHRAAVREARRVLRPGGHLVLFEHVRSPNRLVRAGQRLINPLAMRFWCDDLLREPAPIVDQEGFVIERLERARLGIVERLLARAPA